MLKISVNLQFFFHQLHVQSGIIFPQSYLNIFSIAGLLMIEWGDTCDRRRVSGGHEGEVIQLMGFIYEIEQKTLTIALSWDKEEIEGRWQVHSKQCTIVIVTMNPPYTMNVS
jgi:hypothetical protein